MYWGITALVVILASVGVIFGMIHLKDVLGAMSGLIKILMPIIYGAILAYLLSNIYNSVNHKISVLLEKKLKNKKTAHNIGKTCGTLASLVLIIALAAGLLYLILPELIKSIQNVIISAPENINNFSIWLNEILEGDHEYREEILTVYNTLVEMSENFINNTLIPNLDIIIKNAYISVKAIGIGLYNLLIGLIVMIYLLNFKDTLIPQFKKLIFAFLPNKFAACFVNELKYINQVFGGFIIGKIVDSIIIGVLCFILTSLLKLPYALLVSVIVGVTNVIPFFGPFIGAIPSTILIMLVSPKAGLIFVALIIVLQQFDGNILGPKILGEKTGIPSFWVLFSILLFGGVFGFVGMIIAVPTWAVILHLLKNFSEAKLKEKGLPCESKDYKDI